MKDIIVKEIIDLINLTTDKSVSFVYNQFVVTINGDKVDVLEIVMYDDGSVEVKCVPYSNWKLESYDINSFSYKSLKKIYNEILKKVDEEI